ncbi:MAG: hypothetical protein AAGK10_14640 [Cyanobacteria bacterium J06555_3]
MNQAEKVQAIAMKKFKELLIIAGPSCAGKSTLIKKIGSGESTLLKAQLLDVENLATLPIIKDSDIKHLRFQKLEQSAILHYDLFNNYLDQNYHQYILQIIQQFDRVKIVTLHVPEKVLLSRIKRRIIKISLKICLRPNYFRQRLTYLGYQWDKYQKYSRTDIAQKLYQEWLQFTTAAWVSEHWVLDSEQLRLEQR